jgi:hypothetical protein
VVIKPQYYNARDFKKGLAAVKTYAADIEKAIKKRNAKRGRSDRSE